MVALNEHRLGTTSDFRLGLFDSDRRLSTIVRMAKAVWKRALETLLHAGARPVSVLPGCSGSWRLVWNHRSEATRAHGKSCRRIRNPYNVFPLSRAESLLGVSNEGSSVVCILLGCSPAIVPLFCSASRSHVDYRGLGLEFPIPERPLSKASNGLGIPAKCGSWRNISITLIDLQKGEGKAQACDNAC
jgi:hypothetical protein